MRQSLEATSQKEIPYNTVWTANLYSRALASVVDVLLVAFLLICATLLFVLFAEGKITGLLIMFADNFSNLVTFGAIFCVLLLVYHTIFAYFGGQTAGKMLFGIRVIRIDGHSLTMENAIARSIGMLLAALPGLAGFIWAAFDLYRRAWHDWIGGTIVVRVQSLVSKKRRTKIQ
jgi:uncharacterized RDD family membrane protein YckC